MELAPPRIAGGMNVADQVFHLVDAANDVAVHDLYVIDVEEQLHAGRVHLADHVGAVVDVVS